MSYPVDCPYCNARVLVEPERMDYYTEGELFEVDCEGCDRSFACRYEITVDLYAKKADCLNGVPHTYPPSACHGYVVCRECGHVKVIPNQEGAKG